MSGIELVVTSGTFSLDGGTWEVDNNIWLVGDEREVIVIDAAHDADAIVKAIGSRRVVAIVCTHAHDDHVNMAPTLAAMVKAPILLHPAEDPLWKFTHPDRDPDRGLVDGEMLHAGGVRLNVIHTPGHSPGSCSLYAPDLDTVFSGDTLFHGGPGATGRSFSDYDTIMHSVKHRLLVLPEITQVCTGHGYSTSVGAEMSLRDP